MGVSLEQKVDCRFCDIWKNNGKGPVDIPFVKNDEFMSIASVGALVEGWVLIVPKTHVCSNRNLYSSSSFSSFTSLVINNLKKKYGPLIAFEHGANKEKSATSCGTEHAHLHLVPFPESLLPEMKKSGLNWVQCRSSEIAKYAGTEEYLFYTELGENNSWNDPEGYLHILEVPRSQFFRKIIAKKIGKAEFFDYRSFPFVETAEATRVALAE